jgi:hypothetical protein
MKTPARTRIWTAAAVLLLALLCLAVGLERKAWAGPEGNANPAEQRAEMIALLKSIDRRLEAIEKRLAPPAPEPGAPGGR